jgi:hypothetical protein
MLTLKDLRQLLVLNTELLKIALIAQDSRRILELVNHRALVKDLIIAELDNQLSEYKQIA